MRGKRITRRPIKKDEIFGSELVSKFINYLMLDGKKQTARNILYNAIKDASDKTKLNGAEVLEKAVENVKPRVEVRSRRVGGANFQVPVPVTSERQLSLACKWIISAARDGRKDSEFYLSLSREIVNAYKKEGSAIKKKEEVQRMAEANKAFAQFA